MSAPNPPVPTTTMTDILKLIERFALFGVTAAAQFTPTGVILDGILLAQKIGPLVIPGIEACVEMIRVLALGEDAPPEAVAAAWANYDAAGKSLDAELERVIQDGAARP